MYVVVRRASATPPRDTQDRHPGKQQAASGRVPQDSHRTAVKQSPSVPIQGRLAQACNARHVLAGHLESMACAGVRWKVRIPVRMLFERNAPF